MPCRFNKRRVWTARLLLEAQLGEPNFFVGLTYDDENLPADGRVSKREVQLFIKRVRRRTPVRYFAVGEYGERGGRPHYHAVLFGVQADIPSRSGIGYRHRDGCECVLCASWCNDEGARKGFVHVGDVTPWSCAYVAGYVESYVKDREFALMSRRPGIGLGAVPVVADAWPSGEAPHVLNFGGKPLPVGRVFKQKVEQAVGIIPAKPYRKPLGPVPAYIEEKRMLLGSEEGRKFVEAVREKGAATAAIRHSIGRSKREAR